MAGPACKVIINDALTALMKSLEKICTDPNIYGDKLDAEERAGYLDRMAKLDATHYDGAMAERQNPDSLLAIMNEMQEDGLLTDDVWRLYNRYPPAEV